MRATLLLLAVCVPLSAQTKLPAPAEFKIDFQKHVRPILAQKCHSCHGEDVQQSGLRLDRRQNAMRGGDYGPVIVPGNSAESKLIKRVVSGDGGLQMPPTGPLSSEEIGILRAWIDQGADFRLDVVEESAPKTVDPKITSFIGVVRSSDTHAVEKMLKADRELVKARDLGGSTPLHHAAGFAPLATVKLLLANGADVNAKNRRASTPLHWAIHDEAKVRLLLESGADVNAKQADGRSLVFQAGSIGNGNAILALLLAKGGDPNAATAVGLTPLMAAAGRGDVEALRLLVAKGAKVDAQNGTGATALFGAAMSGNPRAVQFLLEKGADPKIATKRNETALTNAATAGVEEAVKLLIDAGANIHARDARGYSPLMYAAGSDARPAAVVKLLLAKGADAACTGENETARTLAAKRGDTEVARLLGVPEAERKRGAVADPPGNVTERSIPEAVTAALSLLEKQSHNFIRIGGCNSCHAQDLPSAAAGIARDRGIAAPKAIPQLPLNMMGTSPERIMDMGVVATIGPAWELFDFGINRVPKDAYTDAVVRYLKTMQTPEGNWKTTESRRPPMASGDFQLAAMAVYGIKQYAPAVDKADTQKVLARAAAWLEKQSPSTTQDQAFHLMGLAWANGASAAIDRGARALAATQRPDGGWSQLPGMGSDAYATGQALYALNASGKMPASNAVYQKGVRYLMRTQASDGSWHVKTRSIWFQPYFESGFPYAHDQWISAAGTSWAAMALSMAVEAPQISRVIAKK